jgi:hypothetical protein
MSFLHHTILYQVKARQGIPYYAMPRIPYHSKARHTILYQNRLDQTRPWKAKERNTIPYHNMERKGDTSKGKAWNSIPYHTIPYHTMAGIP